MKGERLASITAVMFEDRLKMHNLTLTDQEKFRAWHCRTWQRFLWKGKCTNNGKRKYLLQKL